MKLNKFEFTAMNNPVRAFIQEYYELGIFRKMTGLKNCNLVLEIGCGNGTGARLIKKYFSPKQIIAIDLDEKMIKIAQNKNRDSSIVFEVQDASKLSFPDNYFDAVFDFGIIHHIPNWQAAVNELKRVLKPEGELVLEELSIESFTKGAGRLWRKLLEHPYDQMFSTEEFVGYIKEAGFQILHFKKSNPLKLIKHFSLNAN